MKINRVSEKENLRCARYMPAWHTVRAIQENPKTSSCSRISCLQLELGAWECKETVDLSSLTPLCSYSGSSEISHLPGSPLLLELPQFLIPSFMTCGLTFLPFTCSLHLSSVIMMENHGDSITKLAITSMLAMSKFL